MLRGGHTPRHECTVQDGVCKLQGRQQQQKHRALCLKRFRTTSLPAACSAQDCNRVMYQSMETVAHELHRNRHAAVHALVLARQAVSQGKMPVQQLWWSSLPMLLVCMSTAPCHWRHEDCMPCLQIWRELWTCSSCCRECCQHSCVCSSSGATLCHQIIWCCPLM